MMRILVAGGAGFLGSHLCDTLIRRGDFVSCIDNFSTGSLKNIEHLFLSRKFRLIENDVTMPFDLVGPFDAVVHLASPAAPPDYHRLPLETLAVGSRGTENLLRLAARHNARFVLASTSEVYGDPTVHPQPEDYWGNTNPIGPRSVYDEAKRFAEALTFAYRRTLGVNTGILRIFNTYGPRMRTDDGRVVTTFIRQALHRLPLTIYGDGTQTRSFCYVDDLMRGIVAMIDSAVAGPINLGNPEERSVTELAKLVLHLTGSPSSIEYLPLPIDDPLRRRPVITKAQCLLGWHPTIGLTDGLRHTVSWFTSQLGSMVSCASLSAGSDDCRKLPAGPAPPAALL
jgi:dTDP-glucose 4,6-dehydratase